ncbi:MAG: sialate O-acetylesterase [Planctomycetota bacterium]
MRRASILLASIVLAGCGGGGGGGGPAPTPAPVVTACSGPIPSAAGAVVTVSGTDFPGDPGDPVEVRLRVDDGKPFGGCGETTVAFVATRVDATTVRGTLDPFVLTRDVAAAVEVDFGGGTVAVSAPAIVTVTGVANAAADHDLDGVPDACDPRTFTFESDAVGARPAGATSWDGLTTLLTVRDVGGDHAAAYAATGDIPYDRLEALRLDHPQQDVDVYLDLETNAGVFNCELWSDGSYRGAAGAGLIVQVQASGQVVGYQRLWNSIQTNVPGPMLPPSGRLRLRVRKGEGSTTTVRYDLWNGTGFTSDAFVWTVADDRQFRGQEFALCNYLVNPATRGLKRVTVVPAIPAAELTVARSPLTSADDMLFQRDGAGLASIPLRLLLRPPAFGVVEARVVGSSTGVPLEGHDWGAHTLAVPAAAGGLRRDLVVAGVPTGGNYDVQVRLLDDASPPNVVAQQVLRDVAVGDVWVAAGQSNTSGYSGTYSGAEAPIPEVHLFGNDGRWKPASEPMDDGADQTDVISAENPTVGFQLAFGKALFQATGVPVALVPTSLGGTNLYAQWQRDPAHPASRITLYGSMLHRARTACPAAPPRGLVWFQGESDAISNRTQAQYAGDLATFVANARGDLGAPGLVFLCGQLGTYSAATLASWLPVQEAQRRVVAADPHAALATAVDLARPDGIHFNVLGYGTLGRRFALGARRVVFGHAVDPTDDLLSATAGPGATSVVLQFEAPVTGGATTLFRVTDAGGAVSVDSISAAGATVTLNLGRALGASPTVSYGWSVDPAAAWLKDPSGAAVPVFDAVPVGP